MIRCFRITLVYCVLFALGGLPAAGKASTAAAPALQWQPLAPLRSDQRWVHYAVPADSAALALQAPAKLAACWLSNGSGLAVACRFAAESRGRLRIANLTADFRRLHLAAIDQTAHRRPPLALRPPTRRKLAPTRALPVPGADIQLTDPSGRQTTWYSLESLTALQLPQTDGQPLAIELRLDQSDLEGTRHRVLLQIREAAGSARWEALEFTPAAGAWQLGQQPVALSQLRRIQLPASASGSQITITSSHKLLLRSVTGPAPLLWPTNRRQLVGEQPRSAISGQRSTAAFAPATKELTLIPGGTERTLTVPYQPFRRASKTRGGQTLARRAVQRLIKRPRGATLTDIPANAQRELLIPPGLSPLPGSPRIRVLAPLPEDRHPGSPAVSAAAVTAQEFVLRPTSCAATNGQAPPVGEPSSSLPEPVIVLRLDPALRDPSAAPRTRLPLSSANHQADALALAPTMAELRLRVPQTCSALRLTAPEDQAIRLGFTVQQRTTDELTEAQWLWLKQLPLELRREQLAPWAPAAEPRSPDAALGAAQAVLLSAAAPALRITGDRIQRWAQGFADRSRLQVPNPHCRPAATEAQGHAKQAPTLRDGALWPRYQAVQQSAGRACRSAHRALVAALETPGSGSDRMAYWRTLIRHSEDPALARWARSALNDFLARSDRSVQRRELLAWRLTQNRSPQTITALATHLLQQGLTRDGLNLLLLLDELPAADTVTAALLRRDWLTVLRNSPRLQPATTGATVHTDSELANRAGTPVRPVAVSASRFTRLQDRYGDDRKVLAVATAAQPIAFEVQGPIQGSLLLRMGHNGQDSRWVDLRTLGDAGRDQQPVLLPGASSRRWRDDQERPVGRATRIPLQLGSGRHQLRIEPRRGAGQVLAELKLFTREPPMDLARQRLPADLTLAGVAPPALTTLATAHPLTAARADIARLADRHSEPAALASALRLLHAHPDDPIIGRYGRWLRQRSHWAPWHLAAAAGGQQIVAVDRYTPASPAARQRTLFLPAYGPGSLRLGAAEPLRIELSLQQPQTLRLRINHLSRYQGPGPAAGYQLEFRSRAERPAYLSRGAGDTLSLSLAAGNQTLSLKALALPVGSELRVELATRNAAGRWQPVIEPTQLRFQAPDSRAMVDFAITGPAWVRIDQLHDGALRTQQHLLRAGQRLPPMAAPAGTVLRAYRRVPGAHQPALANTTETITLHTAQSLDTAQSDRTTLPAVQEITAATAPPASQPRPTTIAPLIAEPPAATDARWQPASPATYSFALGLEETVLPEEDETVSRRWLQQVARRSRDERSGRVQELRLQRSYGAENHSSRADDEDQFQLRGTLWSPGAGAFSTRSRFDLRSSGAGLSGGLDLRVRHDRRLGTLRTRSELGLFGYLANSAAKTTRPLLTWSDYRDRHRTGFDLRQRLTWQPYADAELFAEIGVRSNEWQQQSIERGSALVGLRTQLGRLQLGGAAEHRHYFADTDRRRAFALTRLQLQARWYALQRSSGHLELRPRLEIDSQSRQLQTAFTLTWHFDRRQGLRDYHGDQLWFTRLLERSLTGPDRE